MLEGNVAVVGGGRGGPC